MAFWRVRTCLNETEKEEEEVEKGEEGRSGTCQWHNGQPGEATKQDFMNAYFFIDLRALASIFEGDYS